METRKITTQFSNLKYRDWRQAGDHQSKKTLEEILTETLYESRRVHCPFYDQLHTFEKNYVNLMVRKAMEN